MRNLKHLMLAPLLVLGLAACGGEADPDRTATEAPPPSMTLAAAIGGQDDLDTLERIVGNAGLSDVLAGRGPYTVFAPANAAMAAIGGDDLAGDAMKAQSAALLRAHIVPGALTRTDIMTAIAAAGSGGAQMRTMADDLLTFTLDGETVIVTAEDGATARLTGDETLATNGVIQPIDGVLVRAG
ncbi:fasciclin domain-containing protein [Brevundimonas sp.]|uniref:fasciclin domain-containing protein n=1 Tax=Brevundimonas sp. TaxID=1871086 RepID=UPI001E01EB03|nr:fasciclin domain-containing protein [Brevundimonas sp.]MBA4001725.1 hypothetical protein [Brevundimonas sp.]